MDRHEIESSAGAGFKSYVLKNNSTAVKLLHFRENMKDEWETHPLRIQGSAPFDYQERTEMQVRLPIFIDHLIRALLGHSLDKENWDSAVRDFLQESAQISKEPLDLVQEMARWRTLRQIVCEQLKQEGPIPGEDLEKIVDATEVLMERAAELSDARRNKEIELKIKELKTSEFRYRSALEGIQDHAVIQTDPNGRIIEWNKGAERLFGYSLEEARNQEIGLIYVPLDRENAVDLKEMDEAKSQGRAEDRRWHLRKDGTTFFASGVMNPLVSDHGEFLGFIKVLRDMTQKKILEDQLEARQKDLSLAHQRLESVIEHLPAGVSILEAPTGKAILHNRKATELLGHEILAKSSDREYAGYGAIHEDGTRYAADDYPTVRAFRKGEEIVNEEMKYRKGDGSETYFSVNAAPIRNSDGAILGAVGTFFDISERKKSEEALKKAEAQAQSERRRAELGEIRFRELADAMPVMVWSARDNGDLTYCNRELLHYTGLEAKSATVRTWLQFMHPEDADEALNTYEKSMARGESFEIQARIRRASDGEYRWHLCRGVPVRDEGGVVRNWYSTNTDIHDQVQAVHELRVAQDRLELAMSSAHLHLWHLDLNTNKVSVPEPGASLLNMDSHGQDLFDFVKTKIEPEDQTRMTQTLIRSIETRKDYLDEFRLQAPTGEIQWIRATGRIRETAHQAVLSGVLMDITEEKKWAQQLETAKKLAEAASSAKSSFLANMSHEIRTPMTAVLGFTEILKDPDLTDDERKDAIHRIENSGRSLLRVIDDVLDISKIEAGKLAIQKSQFSPVGVASDVISLLRLSAERKGLNLRLKLDSSVPSAACSDPARIRQILINLIGNAIKFTEQGDVVLLVKAELPNNLVFEVCDTGIGIQFDDQEKLFKPFAQADESISRTFGGTGLGLFLSRRLAEALGGKLSLIESAPGRGSRFSLQVQAGPFGFADSAVHTPPASEAEPRSSDPKRVLEGVHVLLAEDVPDNQMLMRLYLEGAGAHVQIAGNGEEALQKVQEDSFDIVLMDIQMPKMDGIQAAQELRKRGFQKPILALTAHAMAEEVTRSLKAGCDAHLTKPITRQTLIEGLRKYIGPSSLSSGAN